MRNWKYTKSAYSFIGQTKFATVIQEANLSPHWQNKILTHLLSPQSYKSTNDDIQSKYKYKYTQPKMEMHAYWFVVCPADTFPSLRINWRVLEICVFILLGCLIRDQTRTVCHDHDIGIGLPATASRSLTMILMRAVLYVRGWWLTCCSRFDTFKSSGLMTEL